MSQVRILSSRLTEILDIQSNIKDFCFFVCRLIQGFRPRFSIVDTCRVNHRKAMDAANSVIWLKCNALAVGEHPLMWHITKECKRTIKSSFVSVQPSNWDFDGNGHQPFCPDRKCTRRIILKVGSEYYRTKLSGKAARNEDCTAQASPCPFGLTRISYNPLFVGNRVVPAATSSFSIPLPARALRSASGLCCPTLSAGISVRVEERTPPQPEPGDLLI